MTGRAFFGRCGSGMVATYKIAVLVVAGMSAGAAGLAADGARAIVTWDFEPLPELMSLQKGKQTLFGYPALQDMGEHCELTVWDDELQARVVHTRGLLRLRGAAIASRATAAATVRCTVRGLCSFFHNSPESCYTPMTRHSL